MARVLGVFCALCVARFSLHDENLTTEDVEKPEASEEERAIILAMDRSRKGSARKLPRRARRNESTGRFDTLTAALAEIGRSFYQRGWVFGTSGNFSAVVSERPLRLAITPTGLDKGALEPKQFMEIDDRARVVRGQGKPSAETGLHVAIARTRGAGAVLHTHSLWSTVLSEANAGAGAVTIEGAAGKRPSDSRLSSSPPRALHLGARPGRGQASRRDSGVFIGSSRAIKEQSIMSDVPL
jgi:hypothetical protein